MKNARAIRASLMFIGAASLSVACTHTQVAEEEIQPTATRVPAQSKPVTFDMKHTVQVCNHPGHQPTWCDGATDTKPSSKASGLQKAIIDQMERTRANPSKSRIYTAEFSFSDKGIQAQVCSLGKAGVPIEVYLDYGSAANIDFLKDPNCQKDPSNPNAIGRLLGGFTAFPDWRLHHNKTLLIDAGDGSPYNIDFSSGNLSTFGVSLHFDHWVMTTANPDSNLAKATLCLFQGLAAGDAMAKKTGMYDSFDFSKDPQVMDAYMGERRKCYSKNGVIAMNNPEAAVAAEGIAPFFTPPDDYQLAMGTLKAEMNKVKKQHQSSPAYMYIAIQHFTQGSIAKIVNQAADMGVDVRLILSSGTIAGSEVAQDGPFYEQNFKHSNVKVRFIETNPNAGGNGQQMHNKFAILNGKRVFSGAGHYTTSGLDTNFETLYLTEDRTLSKKYLQYFKELWDDSVDEDALVKGTAPTKPAPLAKSALDLLNQ